VTGVGPLAVIKTPAKHVPVYKFTAWAKFDGGVVERNAGEVSARCHDEQANFLALNRMHGIVTGAKSVQARDYYGSFELSAQKADALHGAVALKSA
jgi:hypothetical protein